MRRMSRAARTEGDILEDALTSLLIEFEHNRGLLERTAALVRLQEERARAIEAALCSAAGSSKASQTTQKPEQLYAAVLRSARKYCIATGKPLTRHDVIYWMKVEGQALNVTSPERFVSKNIWMSKRSVAVEESFWPADLPAPEGVTANRRKKGWSC